MKIRYTYSERRRGYSLAEMMVTVSVLSIIIMGVMGTYIAALRLCSTVTASTGISLDASNAAQRIIGDVREAQNFELMDGTGQVDSASFGSTYDATDTNGNIVVTGLKIFAPGTFVENCTPPNGVPAGTVAITRTPDGSTIALSSANAPYDYHLQGVSLSIYRANKDGTANPSSGTCVWMSGTERGTAVNRAIIKTLAPSADALQFIQPYAAGVPLTNELKIKVTCGTFDAIHQGTSSDAAAGGVTTISGECTNLRNHTINNTGSTATNGRSQYAGG